MSYTDYDFPHTHMYDSDLREVLANMRKLEEIVKAFVATNTIELADPIQWNITKQYKKNMIVLDNVGNAYLSKQPVPAGIELDNETYWLEIFNYTQYVKSFNSNLTYNIEENTTRASKDYAIGDWLVLDDLLYKVIAAIEEDELFVVDTNIERFTVEEFCRAWVDYATALIRQYKDDIDASELQYKNDIDASELQYKNDIDASELAFTQNLQQQFDQVLAGATVDSEVINARIAWDGGQYDTLGNAIRAQVGNIMRYLDIDYLYMKKDSYINNTAFDETYTLEKSIPAGTHILIKLTATPATMSTLAFRLNTNPSLSPFANMTSGSYVYDLTTTEEITSIRAQSGAVYITGNGDLGIEIISVDDFKAQVQEYFTANDLLHNAYDELDYLNKTVSYTAGVGINYTWPLKQNMSAGDKFKVEITCDPSTIGNLQFTITGVNYVENMDSGRFEMVRTCAGPTTEARIYNIGASVTGSGTLKIKITRLSEDEYERLADINTKVIEATCFEIGTNRPLKMSYKDTIKVLDTNYRGVTAADVIFKDDLFVDGVISVEFTPETAASGNYAGLIYDVEDDLNYKLFYVNLTSGAGIFGYQIVNGAVTTQLFSTHDYDTEISGNKLNLSIEKIGNYYRFFFNGHMVRRGTNNDYFTNQWGACLHVADSDFMLYYVSKHDYRYDELRYPLKNVAVFGDSIAYGSLATAGNSWSAKLQAYLTAEYPTITYNNYAAGGETLAQTLTVLENHLSDGIQIALLETGLNDCREDIDTDIDDMIAEYRQMIRNCKASNMIPVIFTLTPPYRMEGTETYTANSYYKALEVSNAIRMIAEQERVMIVDAGLAVSRNLEGALDSEDLVHPNNNGHLLIYQELIHHIF